MLEAQMRASIAGVSEGGRLRRIAQFGTRLEDLNGARQLELSLDNAYLRLWYLQLWDRIEKRGTDAA